MFNQALLARQAWRLLEFPNSLCARVLKAKYFPNGSLIDTTFSSNVSPTWRAIIYGLELLKKGIIWRVGNGQSIRMWRDPWIPRDHSRRPVTMRGNCRLKWVSDLIGQDGTWDVAQIRRCFLNIDIELILSICLSPRQEEDFLAWHPDKSGRFSVRSAYNLACRLANTEGSSSSFALHSRKSWDLIWKCKLPQKIKIFAWKVASNCLATMDNKRKRKLVNSDICIICNREVENSVHALCKCPRASALLSDMVQSGNLSLDLVNFQFGNYWLFDCLEYIPTEEHKMFLLTLWRNWYVRNEITHIISRLLRWKSPKDSWKVILLLYSKSGNAPTLIWKKVKLLLADLL